VFQNRLAPIPTLVLQHPCLARALFSFIDPSNRPYAIIHSILRRFVLSAVEALTIRANGQLAGTHSILKRFVFKVRLVVHE
jgi:hypothetical protein